MRKAIDGSLIAKKTGTPPDCPVGYLRDSRDAYRFHPIRVYCEHRKQEFLPRSCCGGGTTKTICAIKGRITMSDCDRCNG